MVPVPKIKPRLFKMVWQKKEGDQDYNYCVIKKRKRMETPKLTRRKKRGK